MERRKAFAVVVLVLALIGVFAVLSHTHYEKYSVDENYTEETVYSSCHCFGPLAVMQSYPPQYSCGGINYCRDVNYTRESSIK